MKKQKEKAKQPEKVLFDSYRVSEITLKPLQFKDASQQIIMCRLSVHVIENLPTNELTLKKRNGCELAFLEKYRDMIVENETTVHEKQCVQTQLDTVLGKRVFSEQEQDEAPYQREEEEEEQEDEDELESMDAGDVDDKETKARRATHHCLEFMKASDLIACSPIIRYRYLPKNRNQTGFPPDLNDYELVGVTCTQTKFKWEGFCKKVGDFAPSMRSDQSFQQHAGKRIGMSKNTRIKCLRDIIHIQSRSFRRMAFVVFKDAFRCTQYYQLLFALHKDHRARITDEECKNIFKDIIDPDLAFSRVFPVDDYPLDAKYVSLARASFRKTLDSKNETESELKKRLKKYPEAGMEASKIWKLYMDRANFGVYVWHTSMNRMLESKNGFKRGALENGPTAREVDRETDEEDDDAIAADKVGSTYLEDNDIIRVLDGELCTSVALRTMVLEVRDFMLEYWQTMLFFIGSAVDLYKEILDIFNANGWSYPILATKRVVLCPTYASTKYCKSHITDTVIPIFNLDAVRNHLRLAVFGTCELVVVDSAHLLGASTFNYLVTFIREGIQRCPRTVYIIWCGIRCNVTALTPATRWPLFRDMVVRFTNVYVKIDIPIIDNSVLMDMKEDAVLIKNGSKQTGIAATALSYHATKKPNEHTFDDQSFVNAAESLRVLYETLSQNANPVILFDNETTLHRVMNLISLPNMETVCPGASIRVDDGSQCVVEQFYEIDPSRTTVGIKASEIDKYGEYFVAYKLIGDRDDTRRLLYQEPLRTFEPTTTTKCRYGKTPVVILVVGKPFFKKHDLELGITMSTFKFFILASDIALENNHIASYPDDRNIFEFMENISE